MTRKRIEELLAREGPRIRKRFRQVMERVKDRWTLAKLEDALLNGKLGEVLDEVEQAAGAVASTTAAVQNAVAHEVADTLSKQLDSAVSYDTSNAAAVQALRRERARLVTGMRDEHRDIIVDVLADGTARGLNPREQARGIRDSLGLSRPQAAWVRSYDRKLRTLDPTALDMELRDGRHDGTLERAIAEGKPLTDEQIDKMVARYADRAIKYRAEVIARTEALRAVHEGQEQAYQQAVDNGVLEADTIELTWRTAHDARTRASHRAMDGQKRMQGETFVSGDGVTLRYPCDPEAPPAEAAQCRCVVVRRIIRRPKAEPVTTSTAPATSTG